MNTLSELLEVKAALGTPTIDFFLLDFGWIHERHLESAVVEIKREVESRLPFTTRELGFPPVRNIEYALIETAEFTNREQSKPTPREIDAIVRGHQTGFRDERAWQGTYRVVHGIFQEYTLVGSLVGYLLPFGKKGEGFLNPSVLVSGAKIGEMKNELIFYGLYPKTEAGEDIVEVRPLDFTGQDINGYTIGEMAFTQRGYEFRAKKSFDREDHRVNVGYHIVLNPRSYTDLLSLSIFYEVMNADDVLTVAEILLQRDEDGSFKKTTTLKRKFSDIPNCPYGTVSLDETQGILPGDVGIQEDLEDEESFHRHLAAYEGPEEEIRVNGYAGVHCAPHLSLETPFVDYFQSMIGILSLQDDFTIEQLIEFRPLSFRKALFWELNEGC